MGLGRTAPQLMDCGVGLVSAAKLFNMLRLADVAFLKYGLT